MKNNGIDLPEQFSRRCHRLKRLIILYFEALEWVTHYDNKWQLGKPKYYFNLTTEDLRMFGFKTAGELRDQWKGLIASVEYDEKSLPATPEVYYRTDLQTKIIEGELVPLPDKTIITGATFNLNPDHIPIDEIAEEIKMARSAVEAELQAAGIPIPLSPPFLFAQCESATDLREYNEAKNLEPKTLLLELKQQKKVCLDIVRSLRRRFLYKSATTETQPINDGKADLPNEKPAETGQNKVSSSPKILGDTFTIWGLEIHWRVCWDKLKKPIKAFIYKIVLRK